MMIKFKGQHISPEHSQCSGLGCYEELNISNNPRNAGETEDSNVREQFTVNSINIVSDGGM